MERGTDYSTPKPKLRCQSCSDRGYRVRIPSKPREQTYKLHRGTYPSDQGKYRVWYGLTENALPFPHSPILGSSGSSAQVGSKDRPDGHPSFMCNPQRVIRLWIYAVDAKVRRKQNPEGGERVELERELSANVKFCESPTRSVHDDKA